MASDGPPLVPLLDTDWQATELDGRPLPGQVRPSLQFGADGRLSGSAGVNRIIGGYQLGDGVIDFGQLATTLMAGPPEAMAIERRWHVPRARHIPASCVIELLEGSSNRRRATRATSGRAFGR